jgi:hypothetical protein
LSTSPKQGNRVHQDNTLNHTLTHTHINNDAQRNIQKETLLESGLKQSLELGLLVENKDPSRNVRKIAFRKEKLEERPRIRAY